MPTQTPCSAACSTRKRDDAPPSASVVKSGSANPNPVENVSVSSVENVENYGEIATDGGFIIDDWVTGKEVLTTPEVGDQYCSVTGLVSYNYGHFFVAFDRLLGTYRRPETVKQLCCSQAPLVATAGAQPLAPAGGRGAERGAPPRRHRR